MTLEDGFDDRVMSPMARRFGTRVVSVTCSRFGSKTEIPGLRQVA